MSATSALDPIRYLECRPSFCHGSSGMSEPDAPGPPPPGVKSSHGWRSIWGIIAIGAAAAWILLIVLVAAFDSSDDSTQVSATTTEQTTAEAAAPTTTEQTTTEQTTTKEVTTAEAETTTEEEAAPPPTPVEKAPPPIVLKGTGARVETVNLSKDSPAVVAALHRGTSNFVLELVSPGGGSELLVNEIGNYSGEVAYADAAAGRYRLRVTADGQWTVTISQPVPKPRDKVVPATFSGRGSDVIKIRAEDDLQPIVDSRHRGQSNFVVYLIGYGDSSGQELLVNEIGNYSGQTLVNNMPAGSYLLSVQADGSWSVKFSP
jgi:hypothetical protein